MNRRSTEDFRAVKLFYMTDAIIIKVITDLSKPMKYLVFPRGPTVIHSHSSVQGISFLHTVANTCYFCHCSCYFKQLSSPA